MRVVLTLMLGLLAGAGVARGAVPDAGQRMAAIAQAAPIVRRAVADVRASAAGLRDPALRRASLAALFDPDDCVRHRIGVDEARKQRIITTLRSRGWLDAMVPDAVAHEGLFPPLRGEGTACPRLLFADLLAPGGDGVSHHSWPGGLALHVAFNIASARSQIRLYDSQSHPNAINADRVVTAALWHDWAKALTLQWRGDGTITPELRVAGTGTHHILGIAEAMRRGFPADQIVVQACAHGVQPTELAAWVEAAAVIAGGAPSHYRIDVSPECLIHNLSDQNWVFADVSVAQADRFLQNDAWRFGFDWHDAARYQLCYRNKAMAYLGGDRIYLAGSLERGRLMRSLFDHSDGC